MNFVLMCCCDLLWPPCSSWCLGEGIWHVLPVPALEGEWPVPALPALLGKEESRVVRKRKPEVLSGSHYQQWVDKFSPSLSPHLSIPWHSCKSPAQCTALEIPGKTTVLEPYPITGLVFFLFASSVHPSIFPSSHLHSLLLTWNAREHHFQAVEVCWK